MNKILSGLPGVLCYMDDILIFGSSKQEHNIRLQNVLQKLQSTGVTRTDPNVSLAKNGLPS